MAYSLVLYNLLYPYPVQVYVVDQGNSLLRRYAVSSFIPSALSTLSSGASQPANAVVHPGARHVFVTHNIGTGNLQVFRIENDYSLTTGASQTHATFLNDVICDPEGSFVYVPVFSAVGITGYRFNSATGTLTSIGSTAAGSAPFAMAMTRDGRFMYVADSTGNAAIALSRNTSTGTLSLVNSQAAGAQTRGIGLDPSERFVYAMAGAGNLISVYQRNPDTGSLTAAGSFTPPASASPRSPVFDPSGRMLVPYTGLSSIGRFSIDSTTGALTLIDTINTGGGPRRMAFSRDGKYLYVAASTANTLETYLYDPGPVLVSSVPAGSNPQAVVLIHSNAAALGAPF